MTKIETINLQGKEYAQVKDRLKAFREAFTKGKIETSYEFNNGFAIFKAEIFPQFDQEHSMGCGHSFGKLDKAKSFEKLESIAVGRALALAGFGADGEIASFDEMQEYLSTNVMPEKIKFTKKQFKELAEALNEGGTMLGNGWVDDNTEIYNITEPNKEKIRELYAVYKKSQKIENSDIDEIWSNAEAVKNEAMGV